MWKCNNCGEEISVKYVELTECEGKFNEDGEVVKITKRSHTSEILPTEVFCKNCGISEHGLNMRHIATYTEDK